ncbi:hypothetical protein [Myxococcus sp. CA039A]|uniref:hypothetical protein n=1 Tax=Myxococcus sp. CA039A TaxID=2741737 RepID=UPI00157B6C09|nr:hypothetical protein [Myxococcus sp. CA039A]NTX50412.1 hypothetical protein [Myxococcus sp. CA039A]
MSIAEGIQKLELGALVELFILVDASSILGGGISHFHAGANSLNGAVVWQGAAYQP